MPSGLRISDDTRLLAGVYFEVLSERGTRVRLADLELPRMVMEAYV